MSLVAGPGFAALIVASVIALGRAAWSRGVRPGSAASRLPPVERWFGQVMFGVAAVTWWGILLAELGAFDRVPLWLVPLLVALAVRRPAAGRPVRRRRRTGATPWLVAALVVVAAVLYLPPFDVRCLARDPAVYELTGLAIARSGGLAIHEPFLAELGPEHRAYVTDRAADGEERRFLGFYRDGAELERVTPQFLPAHPVWSALLRRIEPAAAGGAAPAGAALASVALLLLGRRLVGSAVGSAAALLLALHFAQAWFARQAAAELVAQPLFLAGAWALLLARRFGAGFHAALAGACFGLTWLAKAELLLLLVPLAALAGAERLRAGRARVLGAPFWAPLALLAVHTLVHYWYWTRPYFDKLFRTALDSTVLLFLAAAAAALPAAAAWASRIPAWRSRAVERLSPGEPPARVLRWAIALGLVGLAAHGYWVRPDPAVWDSLALPQLGLALAPGQLPLAVLGAAALVLERRPRRGSVPVVALLLFQAAVSLWLRHIHPELMWALRRYLVAVLPVVSLCTAFAWWKLWCALARPIPWAPRAQGAARVVRALLGAGLAAFVVAVAVDTTSKALAYREVPEQQGCGAILAALDAGLPPGAVVVFEPRTPGRGLFRFEAPLALALNRRVVRIPRVDVDGAGLTSLVRQQWARGREVFLLTTGALSGWPPLPATPVAQLRHRILSLEERRDRLPEHVRSLRFEPRLYRLTAAGAASPLPGGLDVGSWDDLFVDGGSVHAAERGPDGRTFRWTGPTAGFWLPGLSGRSIVITLDSGHPWPWVPRPLAVRLDGVLLGRTRLDDGWRELRFEIPADWRAEGTPFLQLRTRGFYPAEVTGGADRRHLGVKVDRIAWTSP